MDDDSGAVDRTGTPYLSFKGGAAICSSEYTPLSHQQQGWNGKGMYMGPVGRLEGTLQEGLLASCAQAHFPFSPPK